MKPKNYIWLVRPKLKHAKLKSNFYDFFICVAPSRYVATRLHPSGTFQFNRGQWRILKNKSGYYFEDSSTNFEASESWCLPSQTRIKCLGRASQGLPVGVIAASFQEG